MENTDVAIIQARSGHEPDAKRKRYTDFNQRIKNLLVTADFHEGDSDEKILQELDAIANLIKY